MLVEERTEVVAVDQLTDCFADFAEVPNIVWSREIHTLQIFGIERSKA
jgi:hypothetical protein